jgi:dTDP-4-amino-4,6-dideoxygalactose transaminase
MHCSLFSSGREALLAILKSLNLHSGEEVILQAYTCGVLSNAIHAAGGVPTYIDVSPHSLNIDPKKVEEAITPRVRAIICQHTFGIPADAKALREICSRHHCALIENCAHVIPDRSPRGDGMSRRAGECGNGIGLFGDFMLLSFGRDKAVSGVTGGAALTSHTFSHRRLSALEQASQELPPHTIARLLLYPLIMTVARPLYGIAVGKALLAVLRRARVLLPVIMESEKRGHVIPILHCLPNACAALALQQLRVHEKLRQHRAEIVSMYRAAFPPESFAQPQLSPGRLSLIRFPLFLKMENPSMQQPLRNGAQMFPSPIDVLREELERENIHLSDGWHGSAVLPPSFDQEGAGYRAGSCPNAEIVARSILTLPTHPLMGRREVQRLIATLKAKLARSTLEGEALRYGGPARSGRPGGPTRPILARREARQTGDVRVLKAGDRKRFSLLSSP